MKQLDEWKENGWGVIQIRSFLVGSGRSYTHTYTHTPHTTQVASRYLVASAHTQDRHVESNLQPPGRDVIKRWHIVLIFGDQLLCSGALSVLVQVLALRSLVVLAFPLREFIGYRQTSQLQSNQV